MHLNGGASATPTALTLANGVLGSAFLTTPFNVTGDYVGSFDYTESNGAWGLAFVLQNDALTALGSSQQNLGAGGITNGIGIGFDNNPNYNATIFATSAGPLSPQASASFAISGAYTVAVNFEYNDGALSFTALDAATNQSVSENYIYSPTIFNGSTFDMGFTGTWRVGVSPTVFNFEVAEAGAAGGQGTPEPSTWAMGLIGALGLGLLAGKKGGRKPPLAA